MESETEHIAPISWTISAMLRIVFLPEKIEKYRTRGIEIKNDGSAVFAGRFQGFKDSKPCFKIWASVPVEAFGERTSSEIRLSWEQADILSVGFAFDRERFWWKAEWSEKELIKATEH